MKISIIGTGYVGLVTGCCLAEAGNDVSCIDNDRAKVESMNRGEVPIYEPGLKEMMHSNVENGKLSFTSDLSKGVSQAEAIFLALPTPPQDDGSADLSAILEVAEQLGSLLPSNYCVIINKSTVPVGTAEAVHESIARNANSEFDIASNPEFLREGLAIKDFMEPERVVVGVTGDKAEQVMRVLYEPFVTDDRPLYITTPRTAELTKYAANTFLVTKISFMNEIAQLCERMDADVDILRQAIGADSRIGSKFLYPGIGCGGSCFPKDVRALKYMSEENDYDFKLLSAAMQINDQQKHVLVHKLLDHFNGNIKELTFGLWGLAFKPGTDDIREAPALVIIDELLKAGARVKAYDPEAGVHVSKIYEDNPNVTIVKNKEEALEKASALLIATEWQEFVNASLDEIYKQLEEPIVFDGRNIYKPKIMQKAGFSYYSIGRRSVLK
jgi:UDPglucose 6-dehydrogenase